ncbi:MAG: hypothetical protein C4520_09380 [Candidatus Abyssobacteria bacterium SURF_5]|uniref:Molybdopterin oxidoreductase n=1 Tax=Abyssobacteria bacterium (strain SURF_5) TaxID=2093360 RepID=A0A3A4NM34_ABYX5|nr:MAG: hypothetical protein C4520_09380 [Candidatus Abyssubacteria bacterium SURF_5]
MGDYVNLFWQAFLVNFLFWASLAQGSVIFAASLNLTNARWGRPYVGIARSFAAFLPVVVILFAVLLLGRVSIFPWVADPVPQKAAYLNIPFLAIRGLLGLSLLALFSWIFLYKTGKQSEASDPIQASPWAVALVILFMVVYTYLAFDLVMSLQPNWYSTLLGAYFAVSAFFLGLAGLCVAGYFAAIPDGDRRRISKLLFAFSLFWMSLLWSQYIVIWYGDIPEETQFVYLIFFRSPWRAVTLTMLALAFVIPFTILMPRRAKATGFIPLISSSFVLAGLLLEKYVLVIPSFHPDVIAINWIHLLVTIGFAALFYLSHVIFGPVFRFKE